MSCPTCTTTTTRSRGTRRLSGCSARTRREPFRPRRSSEFVLIFSHIYMWMDVDEESKQYLFLIFVVNIYLFKCILLSDLYSCIFLASKLRCCRCFLSFVKETFFKNILLSILFSCLFQGVSKKFCKQKN